MEITRARKADLDGAMELLKIVWRDTYRDLLDLTSIERISGKYFTPERLSPKIEAPSTGFFLAVEEKTIIGLIIASKREPDSIYIASLYVHPAHQKKGIGKRLLERAIEEFPGVKRLELHVVKKNSKALAFYTGNGYVLQGTDIIRTDEFGMEIYKMSREL